jgi:hypothetical protein
MFQWMRSWLRQCGVCAVVVVGFAWDAPTTGVVAGYRLCAQSTLGVSSASPCADMGAALAGKLLLESAQPTYVAAYTYNADGKSVMSNELAIPATTLTVSPGSVRRGQLMAVNWNLPLLSPPGLWVDLRRTTLAPGQYDAWVYLGSCAQQPPVTPTLQGTCTWKLPGTSALPAGQYVVSVHTADGNLVDVQAFLTLR